MNDADIEPFFATLRDANPDPASELEYASVFELLAAVLLSAQATDRRRQQGDARACSPSRRRRAKMLALGLPSGSSDAISTIGLFRTKAKNLLETCRILVEQHGGQVPRTREALEALPGVGRKTANVVLNVAFGEPTLAVDTHVFRVANRTGLAPGKTPIEVETRLLERVPAGVPGRRAPLADPARPLRLPGAAAAVRGLRGGALVRLGAAAAAAPPRPTRRRLSASRRARSRRTSSSAAQTARRAVDDARTLAADGVAVEDVEPASAAPPTRRGCGARRRRPAHRGRAAAAPVLPRSSAVKIASGSAATTDSTDTCGTSGASPAKTLRPPQSSITSLTICLPLIVISGLDHTW